MKYLFCSDGSKSSFSALEAVLSLVVEGGIVDIFSVIDKKNSLKKLNNTGFDKEEFQKILEKSKQIIEEHGHVVGDFFVEHGDEKNIIEHSKKNFYNMLILGSSNYKGLKNRFLGFARKILEKSFVPIFIYRGNHFKQKNLNKKILICVDNSYATLNAVISFMKNFNKENDITLLTVESQFSSQSLENWLNSAELQDSQEKEIEFSNNSMSEIENILCHNKINVKSKIHLRGNPSEEILNFAKKDFDLIVLGSHSKEGLIDFLIGSVSKTIVDYIDIPVLVIPTKAS